MDGELPRREPGFVNGGGGWLLQLAAKLYVNMLLKRQEIIEIEANKNTLLT